MKTAIPTTPLISSSTCIQRRERVFLTAVRMCLAICSRLDVINPVYFNKNQECTLIRSCILFDKCSFTRVAPQLLLTETLLPRWVLRLFSGWLRSWRSVIDMVRNNAAYYFFIFYSCMPWQHCIPVCSKSLLISILGYYFLFNYYLFPTMNCWFNIIPLLKQLFVINQDFFPFDCLYRANLRQHPRHCVCVGYEEERTGVSASGWIERRNWFWVRIFQYHVPLNACHS